MDVLYDWQIKLNTKKSLRYISEQCNISYIDIKYIKRAKAYFSRFRQHVAQWEPGFD